MHRLILILFIFLMGVALRAEEWTATSISQPIQYGGLYPNYNYQYYNPASCNSNYYNPLGVTAQNGYQNYGYNPYQYSYGSYGYNPYYNYPTAISNIGGNTVTGNVLRNIGRNMIYSFMRGY